jgi:hypothetical protein
LYGVVTHQLHIAALSPSRSYLGGLGPAAGQAIGDALRNPVGLDGPQLPVFAELG